MHAYGQGKWPTYTIPQKLTEGSTSASPSNLLFVQSGREQHEKDNEGIGSVHPRGIFSCIKGSMTEGCKEIGGCKHQGYNGEYTGSEQSKKIDQSNSR